MTLARFQAAFWADLWSPAGTQATSSWARQPGFAVYRNTVRQACVDALLSLYPAVLRLTGPDWLRAVALDYVEAHPPADGRLHLYGKGFDVHLAASLPAGEMPWLLAVARLDRCWMESHVAADAPLLDAARLALLPASTLAGLHLRPHPAVRWHADATWPVHGLWHAARAGLADPNPPAWQGEAAVFTRPRGAVESHRAGPGACALLAAAAAGQPLSDALAQALAADPSTDPGESLALLLAHGAFTETTP